MRRLWLALIALSCAGKFTTTVPDGSTDADADTDADSDSDVDSDTDSDTDSDYECTEPVGDCPSGESCFCGGPAAALCNCGVICDSPADCTDPGEDTCCGVSSVSPGVCTSQVACYAD